MTAMPGKTGELRLDDLENGFRIWQDPSMFCFGVDAVLLAHYPALKDGDRIVDLGTGFAPIPLILLAEARKRKLRVTITGLELQERAAEIARRSVRDNGTDDSISIVNGDIRTAGERLGAGCATLVVSNPPYMAAADGLIGTNPAKALARTELRCTLHDVVSQAARLLVPGGRFAMIHRPFRLPEIFRELQAAGLEPKRLRFVHPRADAEPAMVLLEASRGGRPHLKVGPPLVIYAQDHTYTEELLRIYGRDTLSCRNADRKP